MEKYEHVVVLMKPSVMQASNVGKLKPSDVCKAVEPIVQKVVGPNAKFNASYHHVAVRPKKGDGDPWKTDTRYCHYDEAHKDYVYTVEWKKFLMTEMKKPGQYKTVMAAYRK